MGFFFFSILSLPLLGVVYGLLLLLFWGIARQTRGMPGRKALLSAIGIAFLVLPVSEELWIAWNFGQMCKKDAGLFIVKKVEVEGFYDDTHGWRADKLRQSGFKWVEGRDRTTSSQAYWRHEWEGSNVRSFKIEHPTARYQFTKPHSHTIVGYKIRMFEYLVTDKLTNDVLAREKTYARQAPWFYVGLDRPTKFCSVSGDHGEKIHATLYDLVLKPLGRP